VIQSFASFQGPRRSLAVDAYQSNDRKKFGGEIRKSWPLLSRKKSVAKRPWSPAIPVRRAMD